MPDLTPRKVLQLIGSEIFRDGFHQDIWIKAMERRLDNEFSMTDKRVVISDCRFPNEAKMIKARGGKIISVINSDYTKKLENLHTMHVSETSWLDIPADMIFTNNRKIEDLHATVDRIFS